MTGFDFSSRKVEFSVISGQFPVFFKTHADFRRIGDFRMANAQEFEGRCAIVGERD
jgi:hypothetical protein